MTCPNCIELLQTDNRYPEELYGKDLLVYKFNKLFYVAYCLGGIVIIEMLFGIFDSFNKPLTISLIIFACILLGIVILYWALYHRKYKYQTGISEENKAIVAEKEAAEREAIMKIIKEKRPSLLKKYQR